MRLKTLFVAAVAALSMAVNAQEFDQEMMAKMMPGPMHDILAKFAGEWDVAVKFRMSADQEMMDGEATCKAEMILNGMHLSKEYTSEMMGQPFYVHQRVGFDGFRDEFFEFTAESMSTSYTFVTGKISDDKKTITLTGRSPNPMTGKIEEFKTVTKIVSDDEYIVEWWLAGSDGKLSNDVILTHKRKKA